ncbi:MAG: hypothetical protein D6689_08400 [Deltaproteobacteria bacterium]|nr:MAG: hypothetical protein D6689_08400 [Deltaproteobacteria bacterium]
MSSRCHSDRIALAITAAAAVAVPSAAAHLVDARIDARVEPALSEALGEEVDIGGVEASLSGAIRVTDVDVGGILSARAVVAGVGLDHLLHGQLSADEIRVDQPVAHVRVDGGGARRLRRMVERAAARRRASPRAAEPGGRALRRIFVTGGALRVRIVGAGTVEVRDVELHPQASGVRAVTGPIHAVVDDGRRRARIDFDRAGADIALPRLTVARAVAVGGRIDATGPRMGDAGYDDVAVRVARPADPGQPRIRVVAHPRGVPGARVDVSYRDGTVRAVAHRAPLAPLAAYLPRALQVRDATATGTLAVRPDDGGVDVEFDVALAGVRANHPKLAGAPVPVDLSVAGAAHVGRDAATGERTVAVRADRVRIGDAGIQLDATAAFGDRDRIPRRATVDVTVPPTDCGALLAAIPAVLRPRLAGLALAGTAAGRIHLAIDRTRPEPVDLAADVDVRRCRARREADGADPRALRRPFSHTFPDGSTARVGRGTLGFVPLATIPAVVTGAFVAAEDARFWEHNGFDSRQIAASLAVNLSEGRLVRGGSTISQQLVKNVFLSPERTLARKLEEAVLTWRLEQRLTKREILELYLNVIELGEGVYGVGAAADYWFGKPVGRLTAREAAFLAALTPAPRTLSRRVRAAGELDAYTAERVDVVLRHMRRAGVLSAVQYARARAAALVLRAPALALAPGAP